VKGDHFDALIAVSLLNIVPDKTKALVEMVRLCKQGGKVGIFHLIRRLRLIMWTTYAKN